MSIRICPVCGSDYLDWVETCSVCGVALVAPAQAPDPLRLPEDQQVVYELGEWPLRLQAAAAQAMAESAIPHGWDGTDLVVQLDNEAMVDALLEEIETGEEGGQTALVAAAAAARSVDPSAPDDGEDDADGADDQRPDVLEYELDEWPEEDRDELSRRLGESGVPFRWEDETLLVVSGDDEEAVEELLDQIEYPDALAEEPDDEEDEASFTFMSELFVAADRLKGDPHDPDGIAGLAAVIEGADPDRPPYGVEVEVWQRALAAADDLADHLAAEAQEDEDGPVEEHVDQDGTPVDLAAGLRARASMLRDLLRPYV